MDGESNHFVQSVGIRCVIPVVCDFNYFTTNAYTELVQELRFALLHLIQCDYSNNNGLMMPLKSTSLFVDSKTDGSMPIAVPKSDPRYPFLHLAV